MRKSLARWIAADQILDALCGSVDPARALEDMTEPRGKTPAPRLRPEIIAVAYLASQGALDRAAAGLEARGCAQLAELFIAAGAEPSLETLVRYAKNRDFDALEPWTVQGSQRTREAARLIYDGACVADGK